MLSVMDGPRFEGMQLKVGTAAQHEPYIEGEPLAAPIC
jgi:hypothetical protein